MGQNRIAVPRPPLRSQARGRACVVRWTRGRGVGATALGVPDAGGRKDHVSGWTQGPRERVDARTTERVDARTTERVDARTTEPHPLRALYYTLYSEE